MRVRRRAVIGVTVAGVLTLFAVGAAQAGVVPWRTVAGPAPSPEPAASTVEVTKGDISTDLTVSGALGYGTTQAIKGGRDGIVTWLPAVGTVVTQGKPVFSIDDDPVPLFEGAVPLYRTLGARNTVGRDVAMVAANLKALGYTVGEQPAEGTSVGPPVITGPAPAAPASPEVAPTGAPVPAPTRSIVRKGDAVLTGTLIAAIRAWQSDQGMDADGVLEVGDLLVLPGPIRVDGVQAAVGDAAAAPLLTATSTTKAVTVPLTVAEAGAVREKQAVTVRLPDGGPAAGKVTGVGTAARAEEGVADGAQKVQVTIALDDPEAVKGLDAAAVDVTFPAETRTGVLLVPVGALVALREGGYAVQVDGGGLIGVELGLFSRGLVEVSGAGLAEGTRVVTAS